MAVVASAAVLGPGLPGWQASRPILAGTEPWQEAAVVVPPPAMLAATERRRTSPVVRLALAVASEAAAASELPPASLRTVFGSGNGDALTVGAILEALAQPGSAVSPTQFHNSVHNAAAGYWSIGVGSARPATCLGCHDWTFGAALMKAVAECDGEGEPVLLCLYDAPMPPPLDAIRPITSLFGAALVLQPDGPGAHLRLRWSAQPAPELEPHNPALRPLAAGNPAARSLPLLEVLAAGGSHTLAIPLLDGSLLLDVAG